MSTLEILNNDRTLEEIQSFSESHYNETEYNTSLIKVNRTSLLTSMLVGATILAPTTDSLADQIEIGSFSTNDIEITNNYNQYINQSFTKYINEISTLSIPSKTKSSIIKNILGFKSLESSWDGYGAVPLEIESASNAIDLIDLIGEKTFCSVKEYYPNPNGTISLEWENNQNEIVSVEIGNKTMSYFVELSSKNVEYYNKININGKEAKKLSEFISTL